MRTGPALSRPIRWEQVTKPGGGVRRLVVLSRADELAFARSVARAAPALRLALGSESHANRVVAWDPTRGPVLEPWRRARRRWEREVRRLGSDARCAAITDARACYPSISPDVVADRLLALGAPGASVDEIGWWLRVFRDAGIDGLAVGPEPSAILADAVLSAGDQAIRATGGAHVRWVDDVVIFAPDARTREAAFRALRRAWASLGLEVHDGKTAFIDEPPGNIPLGAMSKSLAAPSALR
jgi:hypothetical protein